MIMFVATRISSSLFAADAIKWREYVIDDGPFLVVMPDKPTCFEIDGYMEDFGKEVNVVCHSTIEHGKFTASFFATAVRQPPKFLKRYTPRERIHRLLLQTIREFRQVSPDGEMEIYREERDKQGFPAEYLRITVPGPELLEIHSLLFYAGNVLYGAEVILGSDDTTTAISQSDIEKFFLAFKMLTTGSPTR